MMDDKEKWVEDVLTSMQGSQKAKPNAALFSKIENKVYAPTTKVIPMPYLRIAAAVAVLLIVANIAVLKNYSKNKAAKTEVLTYGNFLINDFNGY